MYPSKILVCGEYSVLLGYPALALPWKACQAIWKEDSGEPDERLIRFYNYLSEESLFKNIFDKHRMYDFIYHGGFLYSDIPTGQGLGSSGSVCAAVLDRFFSIDKNDVGQIHTILRQMENYFHGHSSGLDPLVSFYNQAVLMQGEKIEFLSIDTEKLFTTQSIQLINSHIPRNTQPLVAVFKKQIETSAFRNSFEAHIPKWNLNLINALIENRETELMEAWKQLSFLSMEFFSEMIPETFMEFWKQGINNEAYYCKLCGAGGGGLFLVKILDEDYFKESLIKYGFNRFIPCSSDN